MWKVKIAYIGVCFTWLVIKEVVLTQDNLRKRVIQLCSRCYLCEHNVETINQLSLHYKVTRQQWDLFNIHQPQRYQVDNAWENFWSHDKLERGGWGVGGFITNKNGLKIVPATKVFSRYMLSFVKKSRWIVFCSLVFGVNYRWSRFNSRNSRFLVREARMVVIFWSLDVTLIFWFPAQSLMIYIPILLYPQKRKQILCFSGLPRIIVGILALGSYTDALVCLQRFLKTEAFLSLYPLMLDFAPNPWKTHCV